MPSHSDSFAVYDSLLRAWWNEPVDYAAQVGYFAKRSMSDALKIAIGAGVALTTITSLTVLLPAVPPGNIGSRIVVVLFAALNLFWACAWSFQPWPSRPKSIVFIASSDIGISVLILAEPHWLTGLYGLNAFSLISVYLVFFDGPRSFALHMVWILAWVTAFALLISNDPFRGISLAARLVVVVAPMVAAAMGIQLGIWGLRNDANRSVTDPLTDLLNRRGLHLGVGNLVNDNTIDAAQLAVMVVDLDRFKAINDAFGHVVGDAVLIRTAQRITSTVRGNAVVARIGGEEFVIVDLAEPTDALAIADRVRYAIAAPADHPVTASIGLSSIARAEMAASGSNPVALLEKTIVRADRALFEAKRRGGDTTIQLNPHEAED